MVVPKNVENIMGRSRNKMRSGEKDYENYKEETN